MFSKFRVSSKRWFVVVLLEFKVRTQFTNRNEIPTSYEKSVRRISIHEILSLIFKVMNQFLFHFKSLSFVSQLLIPLSPANIEFDLTNQALNRTPNPPLSWIFICGIVAFNDELSKWWELTTCCLPKYKSFPPQSRLSFYWEAAAATGKQPAKGNVELIKTFRKVRA